MRELGKFILQRDEADRRLNYGDINSITTYIYGVTGTGKTILVQEYLGKRKYIALDAGNLTKEALEISKILDTRKIVVIDNLQELSFERHDEITAGILALMEREDIWLILISRSPIPPWLMEIRLHRELNVIDEMRLLFDDETGMKYIQKAGMLFTEEQKKEVLQKVKGYPFIWALAESVYHEIAGDQSVYLSEAEFERFVTKTQEEASQYIEYHVCEQWESDIQEFLTCISIVDRFDIGLAEHITGKGNAQWMLDRVRWRGNFLMQFEEEDGTVYALQPILIMALRSRLYKYYKKQTIRDLYINAGMYYRMKGQPLLALRMFERVEAKNRILDLLIDNSRMAPGKGFFYEMQDFYLDLEEEEILDNPYLMEGMCMLQALLLNPEESERWYKALEDYGKKQQGGKRREIRSRLLYLDIALLHRKTVHFIDLLTNADLLLSRREVFFSEFTLTSNLPSLMNGGKDFCEWSKKDRELAGKIGKALEAVFGKEGKALINLGLAESFFEKGEDGYEVPSYVARGKMQAEAVRNYEMIFVADGILAWLHVLKGQSDVAKEILQTFLEKAKQQKNRKLVENAETFLARIALYEGDLVQVSHWMEKAPNEEKGFNIYDRFRYMMKVRGYMLAGKYQMAFNLLMKIQYYAEVADRTYMMIELKLLQAILLERTGQDSWDGLFCEAMDMAFTYHFTRLIAREGAAARKLLQKTSWGKDRADRSYSKQEMQFWEDVLTETESVTHFYPGYLKGGEEEVSLSENASRILKYLEQGATKAVIMKELGLTEANVKYHTAQIYKKLGVNNKTEAVAQARKLGLL